MTTLNPKKKYKYKNNYKKKSSGKKLNPSSYASLEDRIFYYYIYRCGGKSTGINCIYNSFKQISAPFLIVPEAATIIGSAGLTLDLSTFESSQIEEFQIYLMRLQYNLEGIISDVANTLA
jgi:hypothetical protein